MSEFHPTNLSLRFLSAVVNTKDNQWRIIPLGASRLFAVIASVASRRLGIKDTHAHGITSVII